MIKPQLFGATPRYFLENFNQATFKEANGDPINFVRDNHTSITHERFVGGFEVLSKNAEFLHETADYFAPAFLRSLAWDDPAVGVILPEYLAPQLSEKNQASCTLV